MIVTVFAEIPKIGDRVACKTSMGQERTLKVVAITHSQIINEPYIIVELHN